MFLTTQAHKGLFEKTQLVKRPVLMFPTSDLASGITSESSEYGVDYDIITQNYNALGDFPVVMKTSKNFIQDGSLWYPASGKVWRFSLTLQDQSVSQSDTSVTLTKGTAPWTDDTTFPILDTFTLEDSSQATISTVTADYTQGTVTITFDAAQSSQTTLHFQFISVQKLVNDDQGKVSLQEHTKVPIHVAFNTSFESVPNVLITPINNTRYHWTVQNVTKDGFDLDNDIGWLFEQVDVFWVQKDMDELPE